MGQGCSCYQAVQTCKHCGHGCSFRQLSSSNPPYPRQQTAQPPGIQCSRAGTNAKATRESRLIITNPIRKHLPTACPIKYYSAETYGMPGPVPSRFRRGPAKFHKSSNPRKKNIRRGTTELISGLPHTTSHRVPTKISKSAACPILLPPRAH